MAENKIKKADIRYAKQGTEIWATMQSGLKLKILNITVPLGYEPKELVGFTLPEAFEYHKNHKQI